MGAIFGQVFADAPDAAACERASALMNEATGRIEKQLGETDYLVRGTPSAADAAAAPLVNLAMLPEAAAEWSPIAAFFREHFRLGSSRDRTRRWVKQVVGLDEAFTDKL